MAAPDKSAANVRLQALAWPWRTGMCARESAMRVARAEKGKRTIVTSDIPLRPRKLRCRRPGAHFELESERLATTLSICARTQADEATEPPIEMALIAEAGLVGRLGREGALRQELLRVCDPEMHQIPVRRAPQLTGE